ncbi:AraC family transcriptional regulator, partial [Anoxybacillus gonensis]
KIIGLDTYQVGFNSTSYFIDRFRKYMKMTPLSYKKRMSNFNSNRPFD